MKKPQDILSHFSVSVPDSHCVPIPAGHIHDSYWVYVDQQPAYILQRINERVFPDIDLLGNNLQTVLAHLQPWVAKHFPADPERRCVQIVRTVAGKNHHQAPSGNWRLMVAIPDSVSFEVIENTQQASEAGRLFGAFWVALADLPPGSLQPTIDRFHDLGWRRAQLMAAFSAADGPKRQQAAPWKAQAESLWEYLQPTREAMSSGRLPLRVVHNDAKISNVLFDKSTHKGLCVIDLDTVMPGHVLYDFGDMVRSMCCPLAEDSTALSDVCCDMPRFEALARGYLEACASQLTVPEKESLLQAGTYMSLIMGMRFLTDYLQGNTYYKTAWPDHNLDRARNQITLALDLLDREEQLRAIINPLAPS